MSKNFISGLTPFLNPAAAPFIGSPAKGRPPRLDLEAVLDGEQEHYPWDDWYRYALARGLHARLAALGRLLIREAFNHDWPGWLKSACGWRDDGQALLTLALRSPQEARRQWDLLLRTDGLRGDYLPAPRLRQTGRPGATDWTWGFLGADARRLRSALRQPQGSTLNPRPNDAAHP